MAIMSQLFWGVTVGALASTFSFLAKGLAIAGAFAAAGWLGFRRRRRKAERTKDAESD